jgi:YVTN family beta-propeller protein
MGWRTFPVYRVCDGVAVRKALLGLVCLCLLLAGCVVGLPQRQARPEGDAEVYIYLQPFPPEADRLVFRIGGISALSLDGREVPLSVSLAEARGRDVTRQRLLAVGFLPPGQYAGFSFRIAGASLKGEAGDSALLVPDAATKIDFSFNVVRRQGRVIATLLKYPESVSSGFGFSPAFSMFFPDRPPTSLVGLVSNRGSDDITVFNKKSRQVYDVIVTGRGPAGMALDQRGRKAYVALSGEDGIEVIDVAAGNVADRIRLYPGDEPNEVALTPDGRTLLSANTGSNTVSIIDADSRFEVARIPVGNGPRSVAIESTGRRAFAFNALSNTISVLDIPTRSVITTIGVDSGPVRGAFNRRGDRLYVIQETSPYIVVINPSLLTVVGRFPVRSGVRAVKVDPNTDLVYLAKVRDFVVGLYDPFAFAPVGFMDAGAAIAEMTADGDENTLFMVSPDRKTVLVANLTSRRILGEIDVGEDPYWVAMMGER